MIYKCVAWFDGYSTVTYSNSPEPIDAYFQKCLADPNSMTAVVEAFESDVDFDGSMILILTPDDAIGTELIFDDNNGEHNVQ